MNPNQQQPTQGMQQMQGRMGGQMPQMPQQGQMDPQHHNFYEQLRGILMNNLHIPGIDKVLQAVHQQHISLVKPQATMPQQQMQQPRQPGAVPQAPTVGAAMGNLQNVQNMMPGGMGR